jgi:hypothetical protein
MRRKKYLKESAKFYFEDDDFWKFDDVDIDEAGKKNDEWVDDIWGDDEQEEKLDESLIDELLKDVKGRVSKSERTLFKKDDKFETREEDSWGEEIEDEDKYEEWHETNLRPILNRKLYDAFMNLRGVGTGFKIKLAEFLVELIESFKKESAGKIKNELIQTGKVKTVLANRIIQIAQRILSSHSQSK